MRLFAFSIWGDWLKEWDVMKSLAKVVKISKELSMISSHISTNLSDRLECGSGPYPKSFMSLAQIKDYMYIVTDDIKFLYESFYTLHIS